MGLHAVRSRHATSHDTRSLHTRTLRRLHGLSGLRACTCRRPAGAAVARRVAGAAGHLRQRAARRRAAPAVGEQVRREAAAVLGAASALILMMVSAFALAL